MTSLALSQQDTAFFDLVRSAAITNPFSRKRLELDREIAAFPSRNLGPYNIERTVHAIEQRLQKVESGKSGFVRFYEGKDRQLIDTATAFLFYYQFRKRFDQFIQEQINAGDQPIRFKYTEDIVNYLGKRGFSEDEMTTIIEQSYQFRRAFHFIDRNLIGRSSVMKKLRFDLWNNIFTHNIELYRTFLLNRMEDFSTLILGETGTGKGAVATAIGRSGYIPFDIKREAFVESFMQSFVSINLSQFPESLIESELFGHRKGAFTGAIEDYRGVFGRCSLYGAIFLDEIGEISHPIQIKLLQVLQDREFYPVGSRQRERFQGRAIAATNRSIEDLRTKGIFRDDFYYRMCSDVIVVPTLQQRIQEDPAELDDLLGFIVRKIVGDAAGELTGMIREVIGKELGIDYPWYGNVRELEQCVRRVILKRKYEGDRTAENSDLLSGLTSAIKGGSLTANELLSGYCKLLHERFGTYEEVARKTGLDRRTVTKWIKSWNGL